MIVVCKITKFFRDYADNMKKILYFCKQNDKNYGNS